MLEENKPKTLTVEQAVVKISECISVQLRMDAEIDSIVYFLAIEKNIYNGFDNSDAVYQTIKNALITVAAIKALGLNKRCIYYLLHKKVIS